MSDVAMARDYVDEIGGDGQVQEKINRAFRLLEKLFPHKGRPKDQWTERRVKSFWNQEAASVQFREMIELHRAAEVALQERKLAREKHAEYRKETARLAAVVIDRAQRRSRAVASRQGG